MRFGDSDEPLDALPKRIREAIQLKREVNARVFRCMNCGHESSQTRFRLSPQEGGVLCVDRFDEAGDRVSCYEPAMLEDERRQWEANQQLGALIRAAKARRALTSSEMAALRKLPGGREAVRNLLEAFQQERTKRGKPDGEYKP